MWISNVNSHPNPSLLDFREKFKTEAYIDFFLVKTIFLLLWKSLNVLWTFGWSFTSRHSNILRKKKVVSQLLNYCWAKYLCKYCRIQPKTSFVQRCRYFKSRNVKIFCLFVQEYIDFNEMWSGDFKSTPSNFTNLRQPLYFVLRKEV